MCDCCECCDAPIPGLPGSQLVAIHGRVSAKARYKKGAGYTVRLGSMKGDYIISPTVEAKEVLSVSALIDRAPKYPYWFVQVGIINRDSIHVWTCYTTRYGKKVHPKHLPPGARLHFQITMKPTN